MEPAGDRRPFRALLDVGLLRTTTGNRVFGALKVVLSVSNFFIWSSIRIHIPDVLHNLSPSDYIV